MWWRPTTHATLEGRIDTSRPSYCEFCQVQARTHVDSLTSFLPVFLFCFTYTTSSMIGVETFVCGCSQSFQSVTYLDVWTRKSMILLQRKTGAFSSRPGTFGSFIVSYSLLYHRIQTFSDIVLQASVYSMENQSVFSCKSTCLQTPNSLPNTQHDSMRNFRIHDIRAILQRTTRHHEISHGSTRELQSTIAVGSLLANILNCLPNA